MKHWIQKLFVALIAVMTLGLYIPQAPFDLEQDDHKGEMASDAGTDKAVHAETIHSAQAHSDPFPKLDLPDAAFDRDDTATALKQAAIEQTALKLGPRIAERIDVAFITNILPEMNGALDDIVREAGETNAQYYNITTNPSSGLGEMIFNVYDVRTQADIARFHVRRDNRPQEGYWFNFHYHLDKDNFQTHHTIGDIYWDKNTPPHWMA